MARLISEQEDLDIQVLKDNNGRRCLEVLGARTMNMVLLTKYVARLLSEQEDLVIQVLKDNYGRGLN